MNSRIIVANVVAIQQSNQTGQVDWAVYTEWTPAQHRMNSRAKSRETKDGCARMERLIDLPGSCMVEVAVEMSNLDGAIKQTLPASAVGVIRRSGRDRGRAPKLAS